MKPLLPDRPLTDEEPSRKPKVRRRRRLCSVVTVPIKVNDIKGLSDTRQYLLYIL